MNKKLLLFFMLLIGAKISVGQVPSVVWSKCYGGFGTDGGRAMIADYNGGLVLVGFVSDGSGQVTGYHPGTCGTTWESLDAWVINVDSIGNFLWGTCLGGSCEDGLYGISHTIDSCFLLSGYTYSNDGDVSGNHGDADVWLIKINQGGSILWQKCFGGTEQDGALSVFENDNSTITIGGTANSINGDVSGNHASNSADIWVVKTDLSGNLLWQRCYGGTQSDVGLVTKLPGKDYLVFGSTYSSDGDVSFNHSLQQDYWLAKTDSGGAIIWEKSYGGSAGDIPMAAMQTWDSGTAVAGLTVSNDGDVIGNHGFYDGWLIKVDSVGNLLWQWSLGGSSEDILQCLTETEDHGILVAGYTNSSDGDVSGHHGSDDGWIVKIDSAGQFQWQLCVGGSSGEALTSILEMQSGDIFVLGHSGSIDGDLANTINHGNSDMWLAKLSASNIEVQQPQTPLYQLTARLTNNVLLIEYYSDNSFNAKLDLLDVTGRTIFQEPIVTRRGSNRNEFQISNLNQGIYLVRLETAGGMVTRKVAVE